MEMTSAQHRGRRGFTTVSAKRNVLDDV